MNKQPLYYTLSNIELSDIIGLRILLKLFDCHCFGSEKVIEISSFQEATTSDPQEHINAETVGLASRPGGCRKFALTFCNCVGYPGEYLGSQ